MKDEITRNTTQAQQALQKGDFEQYNASLHRAKSIVEPKAIYEKPQP